MAATVNTRVGQARVFSLSNYPTEYTRVGQSHSFVMAEADSPVRVSQARVFALARGRVNDPKVRCFTFTLDGHDYYVARLGNQETILFDTHSEEFYIWGSGESALWRAYDGTNWLGGSLQSAAFGSNIVVGDDANGAIYFLDPDGDQDDDAVQGTELKRDFVRYQSGQVPLRGYSLVRCYGVEVLGSIGQFDSSIQPTVTLSYSDDRGQSYEVADTFTLEPEDTEARLFWRSLGSIKAPGRLFKITDYGAIKRIDSMTMVAEGEGKP